MSILYGVLTLELMYAIMIIVKIYNILTLVKIMKHFTLKVWNILDQTSSNLTHFQGLK